MITFFLLLASTLVPIGPSAIVPANEEIYTKPSAEHFITSKNTFQDTLELEDHSKWEIAPPDAYKVVNWELRDVVILTPHSSIFSIYKFQFSMTNLTRKSYVRVNFVSHACDYQNKSRWVISINKFANRLFLNDGSAWKVDPDDATLFQEWDINDFVIYGKNDKLLNSFPLLLINARLNSYVRAIEF